MGAYRSQWGRMWSVRCPFPSIMKKEEPENLSGQLRFRVSRAVLAALDKGAKKQGRSRSNLARRLLVWALEQRGLIPPEPNEAGGDDFDAEPSSPAISSPSTPTP